MLRKLCSAVVVLCTGFYLVAFVLFLIGTFGLFGSAQGPLAGVFLIPLGLPWTLLIDRLFPEPLWPWVAAVAPAVNLVLIRLVCRLIHRKGTA